MRRAVINVSTKSYLIVQARMKDSLEGDFDIRLWPHTYPTGSPSHRSVPYAFKPYAFRQMQDEGYEAVLWLDACTLQLASFDDAFAQIERDGYLLTPDGHPVGDWCNNPEGFGYTREQLEEVPLICGAVIGLNLKHPKGMEFLDRWQAHADAGLFDGDWSDHRHDITSGGIIAHEMGLTLTPHLYCVTETCPEGAIVRGKGP